MIVVGYVAAVLIGLLLGLIGGGGSILTVPVLVYLLGVPPILATCYSLFIVGTTAMIGVFKFLKDKLVCYKTALLFGVPSIISVFITRRWILPEIPNDLFHYGYYTLKKDPAIMILFALLMIYSSVLMIRNHQPKKPIEKESTGFLIVQFAIKGIVIGFLTGLIGAGGGFLIIPALVFLSNLPMKTAIGTSLVIIMVNSLIGFLGSLNYIQDVDWKFLLLFVCFSAVGILAGNLFSKKISSARLKPAFGGFTLMMACIIIFEELIKN